MTWNLLARRLLLAVVIPPFLVALLILLAEGVLCFFPDVRTHDWDRVRGEDGIETFVATKEGICKHLPFRVERFPVQPPAGTTRILCFGDSTVYGHPFDPPVPFSDWIALRLARLLPDRKFEVVNLGASGMSSEQVLDAWRELDGGGASLIVVYVGNNDLGGEKLLPLFRPMEHRLQRLERTSRLAARMARSGGRGASTTRETEALKSPELVHDEPLLTPAQLELGLRRYRDHISEIVAIARRNDVAVVLCRSVTDLLDTRPAYSSFAPTLGADARASFLVEIGELRRSRESFEKKIEDDAKAADPKRIAELHDLLGRIDRLAAIDASVALVHYERGRLLWLASRIDDARAELELARDLDGYPIRVDARHAQVLVDVAHEQGATIVDPAPLFLADAAPGLPGKRDLFVDYCHPDSRGHELIAEAILRALAAASLLAPQEQWRFADEPTIEEYRKLAPRLPQALAAASARTALFLIGQSLLVARNTAPLREANARLAKALELDPECGAAYVGLGVIAAIEKKTEAAFESFTKAAALDPAALGQLAGSYERDPAVRQMLESAGLAIEGGRVTRVR